MVTFKQATRSFISAAKAAEKERKRRARESARLYKEQQKQKEISYNEETVRRYEDYIELITSIHKNCVERINWIQILDDPEPPHPDKKDTHEIAAKMKLSFFKPSFFDKIFGYKAKIRALHTSIEQAIKNDVKEFEKATQTYEDWRKFQSMAKGIMEKNPQIYVEILDYFDPFSDISALGSKIQVSFEPDSVEVHLYVNSHEVIPNYTVSQTKMGKLSKKEMPKGRFNELYQDYVCGCVLRVARETLAYLPVKMVVIHAMAEMLDSSTGHLEDVPIISIMVPPETIDKLNFNNLDPSNSMQKFLHKMSFSKSIGFSQINKINIKEPKL